MAKEVPIKNGSSEVCDVVTGAPKRADIVIYKDLDDLKSKINLYLENKNLYKKTAILARKAILANHSSELCVKKMLEQIKK